MNSRKEICRNFQRGSCQYGDRCKFLHVNQQQSKPNPFGFGTQSSAAQQQKPNPFGFGVQNTRGSSNFGTAHQNQAKPFENKWTRPSSTPATKSTSSQQTEAQAQSANHTCTDPESCKRQILDDFKNEAPLWKLTCYGHRKNGPCDIIGDVSYEELRASAYEDAKRGLSLQSIVERERSLYLSKLQEFDNLLKNPYESQKSSFSGMGPLPVATNNASFPSAQSNGAPSFSSFSQLGATMNAGASNKTFHSETATSSPFGQPSSFHHMNPNVNASNIKSWNSGVQNQQQLFGSSSGLSNIIGNNSVKAIGSPFSLTNQQFGGSSNQQQNLFAGVSTSPSPAIQTSVMDEEEAGVDDSVWLKAEWKIGQIPEVPPPQRFCH